MYKYCEIKDPEYEKVTKQLERMKETVVWASKLPDGGAKYRDLIARLESTHSSLRFTIMEREKKEREAQIAERRRLKREAEGKKRLEKERAIKAKCALILEHEKVKEQLTALEEIMEWAPTFSDGGTEYMALVDMLQVREANLMLTIMEREEEEREAEEKERLEKESALKGKCALSFIRDGYLK